MMFKKTKEEILKENLETGLKGKVTDITIRRANRVYSMCKGEDVWDITKYMMEKLGFDYLCTITGADCGETINILYHWGHKDGTLFTLEAVTPAAKSELKTITDLIPGAVYYERELVDLLGVNVTGLPQGNRYPLPDDFPQGQHPLRKSWDAAKYIKDSEDREAAVRKIQEDNACRK
ncbi:MAG: NADH-quinone oxidoreductase subunit C [Elusimicrobium sp.]|jgi:Ni,Fe-hydrogenase III component G|nr:NADH-quinone oxidoreductase subunit C [Elusimicrobium sp.]